MTRAGDRPTIGAIGEPTNESQFVSSIVSSTHPAPSPLLRRCRRHRHRRQPHERKSQRNSGRGIGIDTAKSAPIDKQSHRCHFSADRGGRSACLSVCPPVRPLLDRHGIPLDVADSFPCLALLGPTDDSIASNLSIHQLFIRICFAAAIADDVLLLAVERLLMVASIYVW